MMQTYNTLANIETPLLLWYKSQARALPWRDQPLPYHVWISEIMLQQTRVEAVKPYFERFITALPQIKDLATIPTDELLKLWEGLGYYNRARNLQRAAQQIMARHGGELPSDYELLLALPGIGRYTAGAIASIAYNVAVPAVDGNVLRVITRLLADRSDIAKEKVKRNIEEKLQRIMPQNEAGNFNQALMELGALICLPKSAAKCPFCPLRQLCLSKADSIVAELPYKAPKKKRRIEEKTVFLLLCEGKIAFSKRPDAGLLADMWELPHADGILSLAESRHFLQAKNFMVATLFPLPKAKHIFTHIEWHMTGCAAVIAPPSDPDLTWLTPEDLIHKTAIPAAFRHYTKFIEDYVDVRT